MDQATGEVKALVGGRGDKTANKTLNRASDTTRQPGSTFKILAAYAPALDSGGMTLASVEDDAPYSYTNGRSLRNYDDQYRGFTTLREAICNSFKVLSRKTSHFCVSCSKLLSDMKRNVTVGIDILLQR